MFPVSYSSTHNVVSAPSCDSVVVSVTGGPNGRARSTLARIPGRGANAGRDRVLDGDGRLELWEGPGSRTRRIKDGDRPVDRGEWSWSAFH